MGMSTVLDFRLVCDKEVGLSVFETAKGILSSEIQDPDGGKDAGGRLTGRPVIAYVHLEIW